MCKRFLSFLTIAILSMTACQPITPTPTATPIPLPTKTVVPTATPLAWGEGEFVIQVKSRPMIVEVNGHGPIAVIMANTTNSSAYSWRPLTEAADPEHYTMVNFTYTLKEQLPVRKDATELAVYLEELGYEKIACLGASLGTLSCAAIAQKPTTVALVLMAGFAGAPYRKVGIPKLFIASEGDILYKREIETQFAGASEPKALHIFPTGAHATDLFATEIGDEVVKVIIDFLGQIP